LPEVYEDLAIQKIEGYLQAYEDLPFWCRVQPSFRSHPLQKDRLISQ
jgi:hypothetical protein